MVNKEHQRSKLPPQHFAAELLAVTPAPAADGATSDKRATLKWYTGAKVRRFSYDNGEHFLTLSMEPGACDLSRLNSGRAPLLNGHMDYSADDVLGVIDSATIEDGVGTADCRFSNRPDVAPIYQDVQDGIICNVSVGCTVQQMQEVTEENDKIRSFVATKWTPHEVSIVPIGADPNASFLSASPEEECEIEVVRFGAGAPIPEKEVSNMENPTTQGQPTVVPDQNAIALAERTRVTTINKNVALAGLPVNFAERFINDGSTVEAVASEIFAELSRRQAVDPGTQAANAAATTAQVTREQRDGVRAAMENAILNRWSPSDYKLTDAGRQYRTMSLLRLAEESLVSAGVPLRDVRMADPNELAIAATGGRVERFAGYMGTSDFPNILANVANKTLRAAYEAMPATWRKIARTTTANDFKTKSVNQLSEAPTPVKVNASGEFKYVTLSEAKESYAIATYGEIIAINRQTIINDDLGAFTRIPTLQGRGFAQLESDIVWALITSNPTMGADSNTLFDATNHGNYTSSGTVISVASLGVGRKSLRLQKNLKGVEVLNLTPAMLLVPAALETVAQQYTLPVIPAVQTSNNPFAGILEVVVEPRLDADSSTAWYLAASPNQIDIVEAAYLSGNEGVYTEIRMGFDVDGMEIKARMDFGAQILDWRGLYKNAGA